MGFVTVGEEGGKHFDRELRPRARRPFDVLEVFVQFLDEETLTVDVDDVLERLEKHIETDWGDTNLSPYLNYDSDAPDVRRVGAVNKVKAVGNESRRPLQLDGRMIRTLAPGYYEGSTSEAVKHIKRYLGSAVLNGEDPDPRTARFYAILRDHTDRVTSTEDPAVKIDFRQFGSPDESDPEWLDDYPFDSPPLLLGSFSDQFVEFVTLVDVEYRNLEVTRLDDLEEDLSEELMDYQAASLYDDYSEFTTDASHATRKEHVRDAAVESDASDPKVINARVPFFDYEISQNHQEHEGHIRLASLYQRAKD